MLHCDCWKNISECWVVWSHINLINNHILGYNRISYGSIAKIGCLDSLEANCNPFPYERWAEGLVATTISDNHHDSDHKQPPVEFRGELPFEKLIKLQGGKHGIFQSFQNSSKMCLSSFSCTKIFHETNNPVTLIISNSSTIPKFSEQGATATQILTFK